MLCHFANDVISVYADIVAVASQDLKAGGTGSQNPDFSLDSLRKNRVRVLLHLLVLAKHTCVDTSG